VALTLVKVVLNFEAPSCHLLWLAKNHATASARPDKRHPQSINPTFLHHIHNSFTSKGYAIFTFLFTLILTKALISAASKKDHVLFHYPVQLLMLRRYFHGSLSSPRLHLSILTSREHSFMLRFLSVRHNTKNRLEPTASRKQNALTISEP